MRSLVVEGDSPQHFVARVNDLIRQRGYADYVACSLDGEFLVVSFRYMGRSILRYRLHRRVGEGFDAELVEQKMAPFHAPFRAGFESRFRDVIEALGATVTVE